MAALAASVLALKSVPVAAQGSVAGDRAALVALHDATNGDNWAFKTNWKSDMPLGTWAGVTTNSDGRVTALELTSGLLAGPIPAELGDLSELTVLDFIGNMLSGPIPAELASLSKLTALSLGENELTGAIPPWLGSLSKLETLSLHDNQLTGSIPPELGNLGDTLRSTSFVDNDLAGCVPFALRSVLFNDFRSLGLPFCLPRVTLVLTPASITENGGTTTVTATLDVTVTADVTLTVSAMPISPAVVGDFMLSGSTLTIKTGSTTSTGDVTITAEDNELFALARKVTVSATATGSVTVTDPEPVILTIENDEAGVEQRDVELMLAGVARSMASDTMDALASRFDAAPTSGGQTTLAGRALRTDPQVGQVTGAWHRMSVHGDFTGPDDPWRHRETRSLSAQDLSSRSSFVLALEDGESGNSAPALTLWGRGSASGFSGSPDSGLDVEGAFTSGWLGLDYRVQSLLVGLAVAQSSGTVGQVRTGGVEADTDMTLTRVAPYAQLQVEPGLEVWAMLGVGSGEMEVTVDQGDTLATNLVSFMGAVGGRQALNDWNGIDLAARADAFISTLRSEGTAYLPGASGNAQRVRLLVEGNRLWMEDADQRVVPRFTLGGRWDGGTGDSGVGLEAGGGFVWTHAGMGLHVELQGRYLLMHTADGYEDWGASLDLHLDPGADGRGLMLGLSPALGDAAGGTERLYGDADLSDLAANDNRRADRLDAELAYGIAGFGGAGTVTPYGGLALADRDTTRYRLGSRVALGASFDLTVEGNRTQQTGGSPSHGISARLGLRW